jgi:glucan-binding YG repeat protein
MTVKKNIQIKNDMEGELMINKGFLVKVAALSAALTVTLSGTALAAGWVSVDGTWRYENSDGDYATSQWRKSGESSYYLDEDGYMATSQIVESGESLYYVGEDGAMLTDGWAYVTDEDGASYWYYFGERGKALKGTSEKGRKKQIGDSYYVFDESGHMLTGFLTEDGLAIDESSSEFLASQIGYYAGDDGKLYTSAWVVYEDTGEADTYSELSQKYYSEYETLYMYFDAKGQKVKGSTSQKVITIDGHRYAFDENGIAVSGLSYNKTTTTDASLATATDATLRYSDPDAGLIIATNKWYFTTPNQLMATVGWTVEQEAIYEAKGTLETDYLVGEYSWFWTRANGTLARDSIVSIYGEKYIFDHIGRMQTGFVVWKSGAESGANKFVARFDLSQYNSTDFKATPSQIIGLGQEGVDLYLCAPDELNDGAIQTGDVTVELADRTATFGFKSNGKAIGLGELTKYSGKYYINGLRLDADEYLGYGVVNTSGDETNPSWVVVDANGKVVSYKKKAVQDGDGYWLCFGASGEFLGRVDSDSRPRWYTGTDGVATFYTFDSSQKGADRYVDKVTDVENVLTSDFVIYQ